MTGRGCSWCGRPRPIATALAIAAFGAFILAFTSAGARAELRVAGDVNAMRIEASGATISDVLAVLGQNLGIRYRSSVVLDAEIDGTYSGSLRQVLSSMLDGYSYVVANGETIEVMIIGKKGGRAVARVEPATASPTKSLAAQWRASVDAKR